MRRFTYIERSNPAKPALLAATLINRFVARLGFDQDPPEQRPKVEDGEHVAAGVRAAADRP